MEQPGTPDPGDPGQLPSFQFWNERSLVPKQKLGPGSHPPALPIVVCVGGGSDCPTGSSHQDHRLQRASSERRGFLCRQKTVNG